MRELITHAPQSSSEYRRRLMSIDKNKTASQTLDVYQLVAETFDRLHKGAERSG